MLVLTRSIGEEIVIGGDIHIMVVAVKGNKAQLGITAPTSVPIARQELLAGCAQGSRPPGARGNGPDSASPASGAP